MAKELMKRSALTALAFWGVFSVWSDAQAKDIRKHDLSGYYQQVGRSENKIDIEGRVVNLVEVITVFLYGNEYQAIKRTGTRSSFVYKNENCIVTFTPYQAKRGVQAIHIEEIPISLSTCVRENKGLEGLSADFVRTAK
jgi:hypothetical protein